MANFRPNQNEYNNMTPFKTWLVYQINTWGLNSFPFVESDFDDLTNYAMMMKLMKHFNTLIENQNMVEEDMTKLYGAFTELQNYINNFFDNLDVQDEINNKLDDMVEDGTLQEIITNYLNSKAIFVYNNVSEMKLSTNLINGSYAQTLGYYTNNDCGGSLYKIRTITNDDVVDEMLIIAMNDNTLVAELQYGDDIHIKQLGAVGDGETDDSSKIITALSKVDKVIIDAGNYKIEQDINIPRDNITIEGVSFRNSSLIFENGNSLNFIGTSIINGGTHKNFLTLNNLRFTTSNIHIDSVEPFIQLINCSYVKIQNCWITNQGKQILMWECFDSRVLNTDFEWGGSSSNSASFGLELRSENGGNNQLPTYEYTNNIYFQGCRFESHIGSCIGTTGNHSNKITFESCKFESFNCLNQRALNITHAESIYFTNCVFAGDIGNTKNYVYIDSVTDFTITGYGEHASHNNLSYSNEPLFYVSGSGHRKIDIQLNNNNIYTIDQKTFGLDSWDNNIFINGDIHVNNFRNDNLLITTRRTGIATLTNGDTTLDYTCPDNGWIYVSMVGTTGGTSVQRIALKDNTANYELRLITIADRYVTGFMPVTKGDNITCISNDTATAYITFLPNRGFPSN